MLALNIQPQHSKKNNLLLIPFGNDKKLPAVKYPVYEDQNPTGLILPHKDVVKITRNANVVDMSVRQYLIACGVPLDRVGPKPEDSVTAKVGNTEVTTLIDSEQIFNKTLKMIDSAEESIQVEMFEFGNLAVDGHIWPSGGAESVEGWQQQQAILGKLLEKKEKGVNVQVILDAHKWPIDGKGNDKKHYGNMDMIKFLKEKGIDVVPYPREIQDGPKIQHVKFLAVDGKKTLLGGMNWGNHSPANHDACVAIETIDESRGSEVGNLIETIFMPDWAFAWHKLGEHALVAGPLNKEEQKNYRGTKRVIKPENVEFNEVVCNLYENPTDQTRFRATMAGTTNLYNGTKIHSSLNLPKVKPSRNPAIKVLTNLPRHYSDVGLKAPDGEMGGSETLGNYVKEKIDSCNYLRAELFVLSHKDITAKIIKRHHENELYNKTKGKEGKPFDVQILVDPSILEDFPYCNTVYESLNKEGVSIKKFNVDKNVHQRMHCKWAVFGNKEPGETEPKDLRLLIGSANWSALGLENNLNTGKRSDYPLHSEHLYKRISELRGGIEYLEEKMGLPSLYVKTNKGYARVNVAKLKYRKNNINRRLSKHKFEDIKTTHGIYIKVKDFKSDPGRKILLTPQAHNDLRKLIAKYGEINTILEKQKKYDKGNHECGVAIKFNEDNKEIANTFLRQFKKDWDYSEKQEIVHIPGTKTGYEELMELDEKEPEIETRA